LARLLPPFSAALAIWQDEIAHARRNCAARELHDTGRLGGEQVSLRWIYIHMISEYARHCGHADLIREGIVGATGEAPQQMVEPRGAA